MNMHISKDLEALSHSFADWLVSYVSAVLTRQERFTIALSGGSTPKKLYQLLASDQYQNKIAWEKLHFFWGDERYLPFSDDRNNAKMAFAEILDKVPVKKDQVYPIATDSTPHDSATAYERLLHTYFDGKAHSFDLVLLGLGDNAHTLSLFPGYDVVMEQEKWVRAFFLEEQELFRVTLTAPVVNLAARIAFLVSGGDKAAAVYHIIASEHEPDLYPAQIIQPYDGEVFWFCDEAAAADL